MIHQTSTAVYKHPFVQVQCRQLTLGMKMHTFRICPSSMSCSLTASCFLLYCACSRDISSLASAYSAVRCWHCELRKRSLVDSLSNAEDTCKRCKAMVLTHDWCNSISSYTLCPIMQKQYLQLVQQYRLHRTKLEQKNVDDEASAEMRADCVSNFQWCLPHLPHFIT